MREEKDRHEALVHHSKQQKEGLQAELVCVSELKNQRQVAGREILRRVQADRALKPGLIWDRMKTGLIFMEEGGRDNLTEASNGVTPPVTVITWELWEHLNHERYEFHVSWLAAIKRHKVDSRYWLAHSYCTLVWGWNPGDKLTDAPSAWQQVFHAAEENCGPWSDAVSRGMPCQWKTFWTGSWDGRR